jgi:hypothetical protein
MPGKNDTDRTMAVLDYLMQDENAPLKRGRDMKQEGKLKKKAKRAVKGDMIAEADMPDEDIIPSPAPRSLL